MMPPLPEPYISAHAATLILGPNPIEALYTQSQLLAYGRAVAEACAALVEQYAADPDVTDGIAAAIREMASGAKPE